MRYAVAFLPVLPSSFVLFFFFNDPATTEIYTLSLHDALPIWSSGRRGPNPTPAAASGRTAAGSSQDRKSTRLNSSHLGISYAVFCLKKKKTIQAYIYIIDETE